MENATHSAGETFRKAIIYFAKLLTKQRPFVLKCVQITSRRGKICNERISIIDNNLTPTIE